MATFMVMKAARDSLTEEQREALRHVGERVSLGEPAEFVDEGGTVWLVYDDPRFTLDDAARGGRIMARTAGFPDFDPLSRSRDEVHREDVRFAAFVGAVLPDAVPHTEGANRWDEVLAANDAPASMKIRDGVPANLTARSD